MFLAKYTADVVSNLCWQSATSFQICHAVHLSFGYLQKTGHHSAVELIQGPMGAQVISGNTSTANATFNLIAPRHQATRQWAVQYAEGTQTQSTIVLLTHIQELCCRVGNITNGEPHHTGLVHDALDLRTNDTAPANSEFLACLSGPMMSLAKWALPMSITSRTWWHDGKSCSLLSC